MVFALWKMVHGNEEIKMVVSSREYEVLKKKKAEIERKRMKNNNFGFKKGHISWIKGKKGVIKAWNKGLKNPYSEDTIKKMSESQKNRAPMTDETRQKISDGVKAHFRKYPMSEERKKAIGDRTRGTHFHHTDEAKMKISMALSGRTFSTEKIEIYKKAARHRYTGPKIICVNTGEVFNNFAEIIDKYPNMNKPHIVDVCKGERNYAGKINGEKAIWKYVEEENE